ncbi:MAG: hypothetical protein A2261_00310 [Candidatus Magasanikbacteria bacterium RIFOXYA2_FULL_44_8]|uniref:Uncharacterized protein n=1 Tax=Candidatus Magasanikbacteria bacterium RIFOXYA2_FULL_44_8 TaxID=1798696 RepID=A0A1F6NLD8_9BACT|nr:MAG: hypothetical protein A2261_00310 [Candidatus Magasanikbacteria bacterium RIFOXYA2_FULL_44_8]
MNNEEPTIQDVLVAVGNYATHTDQKLSELSTRLTKVEALMVTKDYLDTKLADLRGDMAVLTRKEDMKIKTLVDILADKKILTADDAKRIYAMEPFAQLAL